MSFAANVDWGSIPAWVSALTPLILAGVLTRALNKTTQTLKEAVRPRTLRERFRTFTQPPPRQDSDRTTTHHHTSGHHTSEPPDVGE